MTTSTPPATASTGAAGWERVRDLPPSAKLVAKVLDEESSLTQAEIAQESLLPRRTVRYALQRLEDADAVESRASLEDARKRCYSLGLD